MYYRLVLNINPPAKVSQVLGLEACAIMPSDLQYFYQTLALLVHLATQKGNLERQASVRFHDYLSGRVLAQH